MTFHAADRRLPAAATPVRAPFEKERGVTSVSCTGSYAYLSVRLSETAAQLAVYQTLAERKISVNLVKLYPGGLSFVVNAAEAATAQSALAAAGFETSVVSSVSMVSVYAAGMRSLHGVMARISVALLHAGVPIIQTGDGPDTVFCLVETGFASQAVTALCAEFEVRPKPAPIVVQKFGGKSVGTAKARGLAAERVQEAIDAGYRPVVVVSAIGRKGEPYATDTLLGQLEAVAPDVDPSLRDRDLLMACGEIISTVIMAQTLKAAGLRAVALTGPQAGIVTDYKYGDAQILHIDPTYIHQLLDGEDVDVVVVAGFQGVTEKGAITTLGRGGSDTTASALGAALGAEKVEIYTHVNGVMTADPEVCPNARTLDMVTYEEVCNMAHQGAKVIHPRAAEIAMAYQIPLWVKSSFERARGTLVATQSEIHKPKSAITGVATIAKLVYFTLTDLEPASRAQVECEVYGAIGRGGINFYLNSVGPHTSSFLVDQEHARKVEEILADLGLRYEQTAACELVSIVALNMWEEPGFLCRIAKSLADRDIPMLQMADAECSVSCLVSREDGARAVRALHDDFELGG